MTLLTLFLENSQIKSKYLQKICQATLCIDTTNTATKNDNSPWLSSLKQKSLPLYQYWYNYLHRHNPHHIRLPRTFDPDSTGPTTTLLLSSVLIYATLLSSPWFLFEPVKFQSIASYNNNNKTISGTHLHSWYWDHNCLVLNLNWGSTQMLKLLFPAIKCSIATYFLD